jgi:hypothetical protein
VVTVIVVIIVLVLLGAVGFAVALAGKGKRRAKEALGLSPALATDVPREWAGAHSPEAKMHRRLAAAAKSLSGQPLGDAVEIEKRVTVEQQILQLDEQLVAAAAVPGPKKTQLLAEIEPLVAAVESTVANVAGGRVEMDQLKRTQAELDAGETER